MGDRNAVADGFNGGLEYGEDGSDSGAHILISGHVESATR